MQVFFEYFYFTLAFSLIMVYIYESSRSQKTEFYRLWGNVHDLYSGGFLI
ncbi:hypothetical protein CLOSTHATH_05780 [Hungatella hathewayi DSM 13479]|uniref:Uncharacterized protein n=1 Tax=Hungatella hathewayi DSM 13479 TaxID=566550 RepID=D3AQ74_9FIRM|nr:hypothetical protein CLOSTHATH_05780 [Hungatella hathewayi DSM 13479]